MTTNPFLLSETQRMGPIKPLLWLTQLTGSTSLQQFESLLALTNLASAGDDAKNTRRGEQRRPYYPVLSGK